jgi:lipoate-protein ligase A
MTLERLRAAGWQLLPETSLPPAEHVALDEVLTAEVAAGRRPPTLRFWAWAEPAVIIGRFQSLNNEVDERAARQMGVRVVRRLSGGGAMFVQPGSTITYSLYLPDLLVLGVSIRDSYELLDRWAVEVFREIGVDAWYQPLNDITSAEGKIGGAAQARRPGVVLHHTTIAYEMNPDEMLRVLRIGREKLSDKGIDSANKRVSPLRRQTDLPREAIVHRLVEGFRSRFELTEEGLRGEELEAARRLVAERYGTDAWTRNLP